MLALETLRELESKLAPLNTGAKVKEACKLLGLPRLSASGVVSVMLDGYRVNCPTCDKDITGTIRKIPGVFKNLLETPKFCSSKCANANAEKKARMVSTMLDRYGVTNNIYRPETQRAIKVFNMDVRRKAAAMEKGYRSSLSKTGFTHHFNNPEVQQSIARKSMFAKTTVIEGKEFVYRGYEAKAIRHLVDLGIEVQDIETFTVAGTSNRFGYSYVFDGKKRNYIPDIAVRHNGKEYVIEVKSLYTSGLGGALPEEWKKLKAKARSVVDNGDTFVLLIFDQYVQAPIAWCRNHVTKKSIHWVGLDK